jgi:lysophospholipase L1-like esterase
MKRSLAILGLLAAAALACAQGGFKIKNGDRVLFYGDSITEQRLYTNYIETFIVTRFPDLDVRFRNVGVGGDRVTGGWAGPIDTRLKRDFYPYKPTVATIMLGMNDASYQAYNQGIFDTYANGFKAIVDGIKKNVPACKLYLIQPSPFDDVTQKPGWDPGYNSVLATYGEFVTRLAAANGATAVDLNGPLVADLKAAEAKNPGVARKLIEDRVHPGGAFQLLMAGEVLKAWGAPSTVTDVAIDFGKRTVAKAVASKVTLGQGLEWTQLDERLPFPLQMSDERVALAMNSSDFVAKLNRQMLKVTGLTADNYELQIDGKAVGKFSKSELEDGVNLALLNTPMTEQAAKVHELTGKHINLFFDVRWRTVQIPYEYTPESAKAVAALDALEEVIVKEQRAAAKPAPHKYQLVAV